MAITRSHVLRMLTEHKIELMRRFGVTDLALFGSTARDAAGEGSDVDVLVAFDGPATSERYFGVEDLLDCPVDLVTDKALRSELRPYVEREAVHV